MMQAHLQRIPRELRDKIYEYLFTSPTGYIVLMPVDMQSLESDPSDISIVTPFRIKARLMTMSIYQPGQSIFSTPQLKDWLTYPIFSTCKKLREEANEIFWKLNTFHFEMRFIKGYTEAACFYKIPRTVQSSIKSMSFDLRLPLSPDYVQRFKRTMKELHELPGPSKGRSLKTLRLIMSSGEFERLTMFRCENPSHLVVPRGQLLDFYRTMYQQFLSLLKFFASHRARSAVKHECVLQIPELNDMKLVYGSNGEERDILLLRGWDETDDEEKNKFLLKTFTAINEILSKDPFRIDDVVKYGDGPRALELERLKSRSPALLAS